MYLDTGTTVRLPGEGAGDRARVSVTVLRLRTGSSRHMRLAALLLCAHAHVLLTHPVQVVSTRAADGVVGPPRKNLFVFHVGATSALRAAVPGAELSFDAAARPCYEHRCYNYSAIAAAVDRVFIMVRLTGTFSLATQFLMHI